MKATSRTGRIPRHLWACDAAAASVVGATRPFSLGESPAGTQQPGAPIPVSATSDARSIAATDCDLQTLTLAEATAGAWTLQETADPVYLPEMDGTLAETSLSLPIGHGTSGARPSPSWSIPMLGGCSVWE
jgi:hypothetical protein